MPGVLRWHLGLRAATLPREPVQTGTASLASRRNVLESQFVGKPSNVITHRPDSAGPEEALEYLFLRGDDKAIDRA